MIANAIAGFVGVAISSQNDFFGVAREAISAVSVGMVSERNSEPSVIEIWAMRDDGPPNSRRGASLEFLLRASSLRSLRS